MKKLVIVLTTFLVLFLFIMVNDVIAFSIVSNKNSSYDKTTENEFLLSSSLFTQEESNTVYHQEELNFEGFNEKLSNDKLALYTKIPGGAIRVVNKETGFVWCSDVYNESYLGQNVAFANRVNSAFILTYRDSNSKPKEVIAREGQVTLNESVKENKVRYDVTIKSAKINFTYEITLLDNKLNVTLDNTSIEESENKIVSISFFPYLGSVYKTSIPGYIFIPSGNGALIRFEQEPTIAMQYMTPFYGNDANLDTDEGEILSLPIYGIVQGVNQDAVLVEIKEGSEFAKFTYKPSSIDQFFNMTYADFKLRQTYTMKIPGSDSILIVPDNYYQKDIELEYTFLENENANYIGFAKAYQEELEKRSILTKSNISKNDIDVHVEAFGRDYEKGLIFKEYYNMTTTKDIIKINDILKDNNINNIFYTLRAFNKNGYSSQSTKNLNFDRKLGKLSDLKNLETYLYYNPIESYSEKKSFPTKVLVNVFNDKTYFKINNNKYKFYSNVNLVNEYMQKALTKYDNIALDGIGYRLYGDKNGKYARYQTEEIFTNLLGDRKLPLYTPNYYCYKNTSKYLNMPLYHDRLRFVTDSVPFLQILLKGYIDYYSTYLNFSSNYILDTLKCIEYGVYPAYLITDKQGYLLADTLSSNYYATYFEASKEMIIESYQEINSILKKVINAKIINRSVLTQGIYEVEYSNGKKIVVNYTGTDYPYQEKIISSMGYMLYE